MLEIVYNQNMTSEDRDTEQYHHDDGLLDIISKKTDTVFNLLLVVISLKVSVFQFTNKNLRRNFEFESRSIRD